ncbi:MAG: NAD-dependent epimerase/dehydratase family protein [Syntrophaceae bacterium]|nr:NAD-dependent epimerase/dehydratase family protein [Syntrophaceae bacterium]
MKALVTGGTGFIGSHLVEALLHRGVQVRCLVRKRSDLSWLEGLPVEMVHGDCHDRVSLAEAVKGVDQVFHLAGVTKAIEEKTYFEVNALGTENLIHACLENNPHLQKFVYLSSQAAAGPCQNGGRKKESDRCEPVSAYGHSKRMAEEFALAHAHEIPLLILRPCAVYGPRDRDIYAFFKLLSKRVKPCLLGGEQHISLCYVQDIIQAILLASETEESNGRIFFLSDGQDYRLDEVGDIFAEAMGVNPLCIRVPEWMIFGIASFSEYISRISGKPPLLNRGKVEEMIQKNWVCDITQARTLLGFRPQYSLSEGAKLTYEWYRKEKWL